MKSPHSITILPIAPGHIPGFWRTLDVVARERKYLTSTEAPPIESTREFVMNNIAARKPQLVALDMGDVVGWCDVCRDRGSAHADCGTLGMGLLPEYRGRGLGRRLMEAALAAAHDEGFVRVELTAHADNLRAIALYEKLGSQREGVTRDSVCFDGRFVDSLVMALIDQENRAKLLARRALRLSLVISPPIRHIRPNNARLPMAADVNFARMNGLGNMILVADMRLRSDRIRPEAAIALAGDPATLFDQIMAIHAPKTPDTDAYIEIINRDGSLAQACGNGTRCVVQALAAETGRKAYVFETLAGILEASEHEDGLISVDMGMPVFEWDKIPLAEEFHDTRAIELQIGPIDAPILHSPSAMSMGNPHAVFWVDKDVWSFELDKFGPLLENHPIFPERANISLAFVESPHKIILRTWERGVGLTQACGSAACAAAVSAARTKRTGREVTVQVPGGPLQIEWRADNHVIMTGPAEWEFSGKLDPATGEWARDREEAA